MLAFLNIGISELILVLIIVMILFGPKKIPEFAKTAGRVIHNLNKAADDIKKDISQEINSPQNDALGVDKTDEELKKEPLG